MDFCKKIQRFFFFPFTFMHEWNVKFIANTIIEIQRFPNAFSRLFLTRIWIKILQKKSLIDGIKMVEDEKLHDYR